MTYAPETGVSIHPIFRCQIFHSGCIWNENFWHQKQTRLKLLAGELSCPPADKRQQVVTGLRGNGFPEPLFGSQQVWCTFSIATLTTNVVRFGQLE